MKNKQNIKGVMMYLILGIVLIIDGVSTLLFGAFVWRGVIIPEWTAWPELLLGVFVCVQSIRIWRHNKKHPKPPVNIGEEAARAEAELDAMYLREHGELPKKPKKDT